MTIDEVRAQMAYILECERWTLDRCRLSGPVEIATFKTPRKPPLPFHQMESQAGRCRVCGQPTGGKFTWDPKCVTTYTLWTKPATYSLPLVVRQAGLCAITDVPIGPPAQEYVRDVEIDHEFPLYRVKRDMADQPWFGLLRFWGSSNIRAITRAAHLAKCAEEARERSRRSIDGAGARSVPMIEIWPVIHVVEPGLTIRNAGIASQAGAVGVMLISMRGNNFATIAAARHVRQAVPGMKVGINLLGLPSSEALIYSQREGFDATWSDRQDYHHGAASLEARKVLAIKRPGHAFFAAVAFKGQPEDPFPGDTASLAATNGVIPTTSGSRTGIPVETFKLRMIRSFMRPADPLAVASGVTLENVGEIAPYVSHILVSTGISGPGDAFEADRVARLFARVREFSPA